MLKETNSGSWQRKSEGSRPELAVMRPAPEDHNRLNPPSCNCKVAGNRHNSYFSWQSTAEQRARGWAAKHMKELAQVEQTKPSWHRQTKELAGRRSLPQPHRQRKKNTIKHIYSCLRVIRVAPAASLPTAGYSSPSVC